jgi:hypothetical protein
VDIIEAAPRRARARRAPHLPPDQDGVLPLCARVIGWPSQVNSQVTCQSCYYTCKLYLRTYTYSCCYKYDQYSTGHVTTTTLPHNRASQQHHVVGALLWPVGPVYAQRFTKQTLLASTSKIVPIVTKLNTATAWLAFADDLSLCRIAGWFDGQLACCSENTRTFESKERPSRFSSSRCARPNRCA